MQTISNLYARVVEDEEDRVRRLLQFLATIVGFFIVLVLFVVVLCLIAIAVYTGAYYFLVPTKEFTYPLYFDYGDSNATGLSTASASLSFTSERTQWTSTKLTVPEHKPDQFLISGQSYTIVVDLVVPESPLNIDHGPLMIETELFGRELSPEYLLGTSRRPLLLRYKSTFVRTLQNVLFWFPRGFGLFKEEQSLSVFAFDRYVENSKAHLQNARVSLRSRKLQVYSANVKVVAELSGIRYYMYHWFFPSAVIGIGNVLFLEVFGLCITVVVYMVAFGTPSFRGNDDSAASSPAGSGSNTPRDPGASLPVPKQGTSRRSTIVLPSAAEQRRRQASNAMRRIREEEEEGGIDHYRLFAGEDPLSAQADHFDPSELDPTSEVDSSTSRSSFRRDRSKITKSDTSVDGDMDEVLTPAALLHLDSSQR
jgi:hypothetical protein